MVILSFFLLACKIELKILKDFGCLGISYPDDKQLKDSEECRKLDLDQDNFLSHSFSPGFSLFLPSAAQLAEKLTKILREQYNRHDYEEVIFPNIHRVELLGPLKVSGICDYSNDDLFSFQVS